MDIIKLNAIPSTNDYLKEMAVQTVLKDFTVVVAEYQTKGKGQMGSVWEVEPSTNLTFSVLINNKLIRITDLFTLNVIVVNSIHKVLTSFGLTNLSVKWPNDIMSYNKKIGGVLIENNIKADGSVQAIIGIGLNVSQLNFNHLPQASSILKTYNIFIDKELLLIQIVEALQKAVLNINFFTKEEWKYYHANLFKRNIPVTFQLNSGVKFTGMILNVNELGQLGVLNEEDIVHYYSLKEIKMLY